MSPKARALSFLTVSELLAMALWFSASAVTPQLTQEWQLSPGEQAWLTMSVQIGFVVGALLSALTNLADRMPPQTLLSLGALLGAACTAAIAFWVEGLAPALVLRFLTGAFLAGVYPPGMKLVATWCQKDRGLGIGLLVGALTVGSALPHLLQVVTLPGLESWRGVLTLAAASSALGGVLAFLFVRPGPLLQQASLFHWRHAYQAIADRPIRLANFGYLGHMWELYAMWAWVPFLLLASYQAAGWSKEAARLAGFAVIAVGGVGSLGAGKLADRWGRTTLAIVSLAISGTCALLVGQVFASPGALTVLCLIWGFAVVADSAQFSAAVSELSDPRYVGTALTVQTCLGFLLTCLTIRLVPALEEHFGWEKAFLILALGPAFGIWSMARLRSLPEASKLASGNK